MRGVVMLRRNIGIVLGRVVCLGHVGCYRGVSVMLWRVCVIVVVGILLGYCWVYEWLMKGGL